MRSSIGGVTVQIVRDWVAKSNANGPSASVDYKGPGPPPILNERLRAHNGRQPKAVAASLLNLVLRASLKI